MDATAIGKRLKVLLSKDFDDVMGDAVVFRDCRVGGTWAFWRLPDGVYRLYFPRSGRSFTGVYQKVEGFVAGLKCMNLETMCLTPAEFIANGGAFTGGGRVLFGRKDYDVRYFVLKSDRPLNAAGVPVWTPEELKLLRAALVRLPCKQCGAKAGQKCRRLEWDGTKLVTNKKIPQEQVHMGRLPKGFNSVKAVDEALAALAAKPKTKTKPKPKKAVTK